MAIADIAIRIATKGLEKAKAQMKSLGDTTGGSGGKLAKFGTIAKATGLAVAAVMAKGIVEATKAFMDFDDAMTQSLAIMDTNVAQQKAMKEAALETSRSTLVSATESAEAFFFLASAGLSAEQSVAALPQVAKFAQAGMFDMATATDLATDAQSALGLTVKDAEQNLENLTRVTDVLVRGNQLANSSVQQFSEALTNKAGAALKVVNKDIEEGVAVLAAFADRGVKGSEAGDKLNQILRDIPRATAKNSEEFAKLGLNMFDTEGNMKNVADVIEELDAVLGPMSDEMKASTLDQLGLNRGVADGVKILSGAGDEIRAYEEALRSSGGATEEVADKQMNSLQAQTTLMSNAFKELGIVIGEIIAPALTSIVQGITDTVQSFTSFINKIRDTNREMKENMDNAKDMDKIYGTNLPRAYNAYGTAVDNSTERQTDFRSATDKAIDATREQDRVVTNYTRTQDIINEALAKHVEKQKEVQESTEEATEAVEEQAEELRKKSLPALNKVFGAYKKILDIQEDVEDLADDVKDANKELTKANKELQIASDKVTTAEMELAEAKKKSEEVTLKEQIAIERQREAIEKLEQEEERSKLQNLELALAKERLTELILESTSANAEEEKAVANLESALKEQQRATENVTRADNLLKEAKEELAKATAHSTENILEMAIAKAELDNAIADIKSLGIFEDALELMVEKTGGDIDKLRNKFLEIFGLADKQITVPSAPNTSDSSVADVVGSIEETNDKLDKQDKDEKQVISNASSSGNNMDRFLNSRFIERGTGSITMNISTGNNLDTKETIADSVAKALNDFNKKNGLSSLGIQAS